MKHTMQLAEKSAWQPVVVEVVNFDKNDLIRMSAETPVNVTDAGTTLDWQLESQFN